MIVDVSKWQGEIDWKKAAGSVEMAILRAGCGRTRDERFHENCQGCRENGVPYGTYWYLTAVSGEEARAQARAYYEAASGEDPLFYAADVEDKGLLQADTDGVTLAFARELKALGAGKLGLYVGQYVYPKLRKCPGQFDFLWVPRYGKNDGTVTPPTIDCDLHQYTSNGQVEGIRGRVDVNRLCGEVDLEWFTRRAGKYVRVAARGTWHVRSGNGKDFDSLGVAKSGERWPYVARAENGWLCFLYEKGTLGWISGLAGEVES